MEKGMQEDACQSHALAGRFQCAVCGGTPRIAEAKTSAVKPMDNAFPITVTLSCCGHTITRTINSRQDLMWTNVVFEEVVDGKEV